MSMCVELQLLFFGQVRGHEGLHCFVKQRVLKLCCRRPNTDTLGIKMLSARQERTTLGSHKIVTRAVKMMHVVEQGD